MLSKIKEILSRSENDEDDGSGVDISQPEMDEIETNLSDSSILGFSSIAGFDKSNILGASIQSFVTQKLQERYGNDLSETFSQGNEDPSEIVIGKGIQKILTVVAFTIPIYIALAWVGVLPFIGDSGIVLSIIIGFLLSAATAVGMIIVWLTFTISNVVDESKKINTILPEALSFMYAQSNSDVNYLNIIRAMAMAEDAYGPVSKEFQEIVRRCEYFGEDVQTAIKKQAEDTPSEELSRVLSNMLSHIKNGSNLTEFFEEEAKKARNRVKNEHEVATDFLSFLSTIYATVGLMPVFGLAVLVGISSFQDIPNSVMVVVAYLLVPTVSITFVYLISRAHVEESSLGTLKDTRKEGITSLSKGEKSPKGNVTHRTLSTAFGIEDDTVDNQDRTEVGESLHPATDGVFNIEKVEKISSNIEGSKLSWYESKDRLKDIAKDPITFFTDRPSAALYLTVPFTILFMAMQVLLGIIPAPSISSMEATPIISTLRWVYIPIAAIFGPTAIFYHNKKVRGAKIQQSFPDTLRQLASANDSGLSLTESIEEVGNKSSNIVNREMGVVAAKSKMGVPVDKGLAEFNNVYKQPQIARSTRLLIEAYRASSSVSDVLSETIESAEVGLQLKEDEESEKKSQLLTIGVVTLAGAGLLLIVDRFFLQLALEGIGIGVLTQSGGLAGAAEAAQQQNTESSKAFLSMVLFHAAFIHTFLAGIFLGFLTDKSFTNGMKYSLVLSGAVISLWMLL